MTAPWPCSTCQSSGFRNVGSRGFCLAHWCALVATFGPSSLPEHGVMLPTGADYSDGWHDCTCGRCGATATIAPASPCPWCMRRLRERDLLQRQLLLGPPLPDRDDRGYPAALAGWAKRVAVAVESGLITDDEARRAAHRLDRRAATG